MSRILRRRPSPAMIVAFVALCVALAGTATALPGRSRVKKDDIARAAVRAKHLYTNAVRTKHIRARNVTRSKISRRADQLRPRRPGRAHRREHRRVVADDGSQCRQANAARWRRSRSWLLRGPVACPVLSLNGLTLAASCAAGPTLSVAATTTVAGATIHSGGTYSAGGGTGFYAEDDSFNPGDPRSTRS